MQHSSIVLIIFFDCFLVIVRSTNVSIQTRAYWLTWLLPLLTPCPYVSLYSTTEWKRYPMAHKWWPTNTSYHHGLHYHIIVGLKVYMKYDKHTKENKGPGSWWQRKEMHFTTAAVLKYLVFAVFWCVFLEVEHRSLGMCVSENVYLSSDKCFLQ